MGWGLSDSVPTASRLLSRISLIHTFPHAYIIPPSAYELACFFLLMFTVSRFNTVRRVCELSRIFK